RGLGLRRLSVLTARAPRQQQGRCQQQFRPRQETSVVSPARGCSSASHAALHATCHDFGPQNGGAARSQHGSACRGRPSATISPHPTHRPRVTPEAELCRSPRTASPSPIIEPEKPTTCPSPTAPCGPWIY